MWGSKEISHRDWDLGAEHLVYGVDVELELCRYRYYRTAVSDCSSDKLQYALVMLLGIVLLHQIDLVLENDNVVELHDFDSSEMLAGLRLWAGFVSGNE
jgi:hypothetical protein